MIRGEATEVIDVGHLLPLAFQDWFRRNDAQVSGAPESLLLVDDSAFFRDMLAPVLKAAGHEVTAAAGAEEALVVLKSDRQFGIVVCDIEMPGMSGYELAKAMRRDSRRSNVIDCAVGPRFRSDNPARTPSRIRRLRCQIRSPGPDRGFETGQPATGRGGVRTA